jgi:adenylosuccinate lyase
MKKMNAYKSGKNLDYMDELEAIGPVDGRYRKSCEEISDFFSEKALISYRVNVELEYLIALSEKKIIRNIAKDEKAYMRELFGEISLEHARIIKKIETRGYGKIKASNHDVKAVEYFMKDKLKFSSLSDIVEWIHFGLTSEDTNNIAYGLMINDCLENSIIPSLENVLGEIVKLGHKNKKVVMLARTHGQPASPTTFGKEFRVYSSRIERQLNQLRNYEILVKLNGATGNYNAHHAAFPKVNWIRFTKDFVKRYSGKGKKLKANLITTQIEPHDTYAELFDNLRRINTILIDFNQDVWRYISDDWIKQKPVEGEIGSSTMPHKINPIDFENSEGNLGLANSFFSFFSSNLPVSRLQRHLSDTTIERNFGTAFSHCIIAYKSLLRGLGKIEVNEKKVGEELKSHPEVIAEAIQTILRREGIAMPYEKLKDMTRGKKVSMEDFGEFIDGLNISRSVKKELRSICPENYIGITKRLVDESTE